MNSRIQQLLEFIYEDPNDVFTHYALALEYWNLNQLDEALASMLKAKELDNDYLAIYYQLGKIFEALKEYSKARDIFEEGMRIAKSQQNSKTYSELEFALEDIEDL